MKKTMALKHIKEAVDTILHDSEMELRNLFEKSDSRYYADHADGLNFNTVEIQDQMRKIRADMYGLALKVAAVNGFEIPELKKKPVTKYRKPKGKKNGLDRRTAKTSLR